MKFNKWEKTIREKPTVNEMIELTQFEHLSENIVHKKLDRKEEETLAYAKKARPLVESWNKE